MDAKGIIQTIEATQPDLWRRCYPRLYQADGNYGSPKIPAAVHATALHWVGTDYRGAPATARNVYLAFCVAQQYQQPVLHIAPQLLAAIGQTEPPADLLWTEMPLPFEAATLMLPRGAMYHPTDGEVLFLSYARIRAGRVLQVEQWPAVKLEQDVFIVYTGLADKPGMPMLDTVLNAATEPHIGDSHQPGQHAFPARNGYYELPIAAGESEFLQQCRSLVFSLLLAVESRPALISHGRKTGTHPKSQREIWTPNVIGREFRVGRERGEVSHEHASPRMHWRRGHYRRQPYGPQLAMVRTIWIEPVLVGGELPGVIHD